jgi:uncharacterized protein YjiS (DUF1127 family)
MATISKKLSRLSFLGHWRVYAGSDLDGLSDRALRDIGLCLERRDLNAVKPFWVG